MQKLLITLALAASTAASASTFTATPGRTVYVQGVVDGGILEVATAIDRLSAADQTPIDIIINSPGGAVLPGIQVVSAIRVAQSRGVRFRCFVPVMAASMAMIIFNECDDRFALDQALFLWHSIRVNFRGSLTPQAAAAARHQMLILQQDFNQRMIDNLDIAASTFYYHYFNELFLVGLYLKDLSPGYLTIVNNFEGVGAPFDL